MRKILIMAIAMLPFLASAQLTARSLKAANGETVGFYEFKPAGYSTYTGKYPLIISLHGVSERGNGTTDLYKITAVGIPKYIAKRGWTMNFNNGSGKRESFLVLAPQLSSAYGAWQNFYIDEMINYAVKNLKVDPTRIILTGLSLGGGGVWKYATSSSANAAKLAAIMPVCGTCSVVSAANVANNYLATYAFHATNDTRVSYNCSKNAVDAINALNPKKKAILKSYSTGGHVIWDMAWDTTYTYQKPNAWEWMLAQRNTSTTVSSPAPVVNEAPVANAGSNKSITLPTNSTTLSGSGTDDGSISSYAWTKVSGPSSGSISSASSASTSVTSLVAGTYVFRLTVKDNTGLTDTDDVTVTVNSATSVNAAPIAKAGGDKTISTTSVALDGSASTDDKGINSYRWVQLDGPATATISGATTSKATMSGLKAGLYKFRLRVYDAEGLVGVDDVLITVGASSTNAAPVARAGSDRTVSATYTALDGSASTDDKAIVTYKWVMLSGPAAATFTNDASVKTNVSGLKPGLYKFRLRTWDAEGLLDVDDVLITIK